MISLDPGANRSTRAYQAVWALVFFGLLAVSAMLRPSPEGHGTHTQLGLPPCPSVLIFHRPCPGCGMTTSFTHMAHGQFVEALRAHPFGPLTFLGWGLSALAAGYGSLKGLRFNTDSRSFQWVLAVFAIAFFGYGVIRFQQGFAVDPSRIDTVRAVNR